jgi:hypothetical protein
LSDVAAKVRSTVTSGSAKPFGLLPGNPGSAGVPPKEDPAGSDRCPQRGDLKETADAVYPY